MRHDTLMVAYIEMFFVTFICRRGLKAEGKKEPVYKVSVTS